MVCASVRSSGEGEVDLWYSKAPTKQVRCLLLDLWFRARHALAFPHARWKQRRRLVCLPHVICQPRACPWPGLVQRVSALHSQVSHSSGHDKQHCCGPFSGEHQVRPECNGSSRFYSIPYFADHGPKNERRSSFAGTGVLNAWSPRCWHATVGALVSMSADCGVKIPETVNDHDGTCIILNHRSSKHQQDTYENSQYYYEVGRGKFSPCL